MGRNLGAGFAGVVIAGLLVWVVEMIGHSIFPVPEGPDFSDIEALPIGALLAVVVAWIVGAIGGTFAACRIATAPPYIYAILVGGFILLGIGFMLSIIPHPTWMAVTGVVGTIVGAWLGMFLAGKKAPAE